jgi:hypothetical protein
MYTKMESNEKENFTVVAAVTAAGDKLPPEFISAGKTSRVERTQIGQVDGDWRSHSYNKRQTSGFFKIAW